MFFSLFAWGQTSKEVKGLQEMQDYLLGCVSIGPDIFTFTPTDPIIIKFSSDDEYKKIRGVPSFDKTYGFTTFVFTIGERMYAIGYMPIFNGGKETVTGELYLYARMEGKAQLLDHVSGTLRKEIKENYSYDYLEQKPYAVCSKEFFEVTFIVTKYFAVMPGKSLF